MKDVEPCLVIQGRFSVGWNFSQSLKLEINVEKAFQAKRLIFHNPQYFDYCDKLQKAWLYYNLNYNWGYWWKTKFKGPILLSFPAETYEVDLEFIGLN